MMFTFNLMLYNLSNWNGVVKYAYDLILKKAEGLNFGNNNRHRIVYFSASCVKMLYIKT
jgi:hypothetical protein